MSLPGVRREVAPKAAGLLPDRLPEVGAQLPEAAPPWVCAPPDSPERGLNVLSQRPAVHKPRRRQAGTHTPFLKNYKLNTV